jgi:hypothetical protein
MYFLYYINYKAYPLYIKQGDEHRLAIYSAKIGVTLCLFLNTISILNFYCAFLKTEPRVILHDAIREKLFLMAAIIFMINYFLVYFNGNYVNIFSDFSCKDGRNNHSSLLFYLYLFGSFIFVILSFLCVDYVKHGHITGSL